MTRSIPTNPLTGNEYLCSIPASLREIWGAISPTNAMLPAAVTHALIKAMQAMSKIVFSLLVETPRLFTVSSSKRMVSSNDVFAISRGMNTISHGRIAVMVNQFADQMLPFFQTIAIS